MQSIYECSESWQNRETAFCTSMANACPFKRALTGRRHAESNFLRPRDAGTFHNREIARVPVVRFDRQRDHRGENDYVYFRVTRARGFLRGREKYRAERTHAQAGVSVRATTVRF